MNKNYKLDKEEQEILEAVESGQWHLVSPKPSELNRYIKIARNTLRKDKRVNIRISGADLEGLKMKAIQEGLPYQTFISSILHKYITGQVGTTHHA